jgi:hypothetical protein
MDYIESIKLHHSFVSFSSVHNVFFISLWNGILRDGKVEDIDIHFFESKEPTIINGFLSFDNKKISLSIPQLQHLSLFFPQCH